MSNHLSEKIKDIRRMLRKFITKKLKSQNIAMKTKSCLKKLKDLSKSSEQLAAVNKATNSNNKVDFQKSELSNHKLRHKNAAFSDSEDTFLRKGISKYGYGG